MSMINKIQDERLRKLAQTLRDSGLAASDSEAIRMAEGMTKTEAKITRKEPVVQEQKPAVKQEPIKQESNSGFSVPNNSSVEQQQDDDEEEIPGSIEKLSQDNMVTSSYASSHEDINDLTVEEAAGLTESKQEVVQQESHEEPAKEESKEEDNSQDDEDDEDLEEETRELTQEESKPPKKDLKEFKESQVDLGSVFRFKG